MFSAAIPSNVLAQDDSSIPSPEFIGVSVNGETVTRYVFDVNTTVKISYSADRFAVDGVLLLGSGSNLTEDLSAAEGQNYSMTLERKFRDKKFFSIEINVTEFTKFYAWAWSGDINNGTRELIENFDTDREGGQGFHYLWVTQEERYPEFQTVRNATAQEGSTRDFVTQLGSTVTIEYRVFNPENNTNAVIAFSDNNTNVYNSTTSKQFNMTFLNFDSSTNYSTFAYNYTLNTRVVFFSAFNSKGWERSGTDSQTGIIHKLSSYFLVNSTLYDLDKREFSDLDLIGFNITTYNQTQEDLVFVRYRTYDNLTDSDPSNWTDVQLMNFTSPYEVNKTINNVTTSTTLVTEYRFELNETLQFDQKIEVQPYVKNRNFTEYLEIKLFEIVDSRPSGVLFMGNNTYTNVTDYTVFFKATTEKGSLDLVEILYGVDPTNLSKVEVTNRPNIDTKANATVVFDQEGNFTFILNITNSLNRTQSITAFLIVDHTNPTTSLTETETSADGTVTVNFNVEDESGILISYIDWGDGLVQDVTNMTVESHTYRKSGDYQIMLVAQDKAGNIAVASLNVTITLPTSSETINNGGPIEVVSILSVFVLIPIIRRKRKS